MTSVKLKRDVINQLNLSKGFISHIMFKIFETKPLKLYYFELKLLVSKF